VRRAARHGRGRRRRAARGRRGRRGAGNAPPRTGAFPPALKAARAQILAAMAALPRHAGVQHAACGALQRLAEDAEARAALLAVPAPPDGHATDQPADESALAARAAWRGCRAHCAAHAVLAALRALGDAPAVVEAAGGALAALARDCGARAALADSGAAQSVLTALDRCPPPHPPPPRTKRTRRVPHPVLIGHISSLTGALPPCPCPKP
jgi:hypothetical protein